LKILHVIPSYAPAFRYGGTIVSSEGLCKALVEQGHEVTVCTSNLNAGEIMDLPYQKPVDRSGVNVHYFPVSQICSILSSRLYFSPLMKQWLKENIENFDIVHLHSVFLWPTYIAARLSTKMKIPYVLSPRGMLVKQLIQSKSALIKRLWIRFIERKNLKQAALIHFTSKREYLDSKELAINFNDYAIVPNGVDTPLNDNSLSSKAPLIDDPYILFLGRINWKKGLEKLIKSFASSQNSQQVKLVIAGNDEESYQAQLEDLIMDLGIAEQVIFVGFVDGDEKQSLLKHAICLALCSDNENFGNVVLEALSVATPALLTSGVGASHIVKQHQAGLVVDNNETEITTAIDKLVSSSSLRKAMGDRGQKVIQSNYSWEHVVKKLVKHYSDLVK